MFRLLLVLIPCLTVPAYSQPGPIEFSGDLGLRPPEIRRALRATRSRTLIPRIPGLWNGWRLRPDYGPETAESDAARLRSLYYERGYLAADVRVESVAVANGSASLRFSVHSGPRFLVRRINGRPASPELSDVCRNLFDQRREAERTGVLDFSARLEFHEEPPPSPHDPRRWADVTAAVSKGPAYRAARIEFRGNHHFSDTTLRRMLRIEEGAPLDPLRIRQSLARLNRSGWFEPLTPANVIVQTTPDSEDASVLIALQERRPGNWSFSGPVGPMSVGGPLRFTIGSRLLAWGRGLLHLSTYTASANLMLFAKPLSSVVPFLPNRRFIRLFSIERPVIPGDFWLSGFSVAPQLGWPGMLAGYGTAHARYLLLGALASDRELTPDLPVTVVNDHASGVLNCSLPQRRLDRVRRLSGTAVNLLFSFSPF